MLITNNSRKEMPYERFLSYGAENLTEAELLAIILRTGTRHKSALEVAEEVLQLAKYPRVGLLGLHDLDLQDLEQVPGIGPVKAVKLKCLTELCARMSRARIGEEVLLTHSGQVADYYMEQLRHRTTEAVYIVGVDNKGRRIGEKKLSEGSVRMALISPREVYVEALHMKAINILLLHNHPSGDPTPSAHDTQMTQHLKQTGEWMDIPLLDHIIIGDNKYFSYKEAGLL